MKKIITITLLFIAASAFAQEVIKKEKSHEIKINAFNTIIFKSIDLSYEYLINDESSVGVSFLVNLNDENSDGPNYNETFALTTYYRHFFSRKYAWGFFMEAFGMYNTQESDNYDYYYEDVNYISSHSVHKTDNFALGISIGAKFVSQKGFVFEFFAGVGRNLFTSDSSNNYELVPRLGTSFGYRF